MFLMVLTLARNIAAMGSKCQNRNTSVPPPNCRHLCGTRPSAIRRQRDTSKNISLVWCWSRNCRLRTQPNCWSVIARHHTSVPPPNCRHLRGTRSSALRRQRDTSKNMSLVWRLSRNCRLRTQPNCWSAIARHHTSLFARRRTSPVPVLTTC